MHVCIVVVLIAFGCGFLILWVTEKAVFVKYTSKYESYPSPENELTESQPMNDESTPVQGVNGVHAERRDGLTTAVLVEPSLTAGHSTTGKHFV